MNLIKVGQTLMAMTDIQGDGKQEIIFFFFKRFGSVNERLG